MHTWETEGKPDGYLIFMVYRKSKLLDWITADWNFSASVHNHCLKTVSSASTGKAKGKILGRMAAAPDAKPVFGAECITQG